VKYVGLTRSNPAAYRNGMQREMEGRILYGSKTFLKRAKVRLGIEERVRVRGRPKKRERYEK